MKNRLIILIASILLVSCSTKDNLDKKDFDKLDNSSALISKRSKELGCNLTIKPGDSFFWAFAKLSDGELLCLADGKYSQLMSIPDNINVRALHDGKAELDGRGINAGWKAILTMVGKNSSVRGLKVHHASYNAKACLVGGENNHFDTMSCSHGGQYKHAIPLAVSGVGHVIENSWFYGEGRYLLMCYQGEGVKIRRNVFRWDKTKAGFPNEPNAAMSNYSCSNTIWENNISLDYGRPDTPMKHCGDICLSTTPQLANKNVGYFGNIVINHHKATKNNIGFRADQKSRERSSNLVVIDNTIIGARAGIAINPKYKDIVVKHCTLLDVKKTVFYNGRKQTCNSISDFSHIYRDGNKTTDNLWPWPNQDLIKNDMCATGERQSDWCKSNKTLTQYVLNYIEKAKSSESQKLKKP